MEETVAKFTNEQGHIFKDVMDAVSKRKPIYAFIDAMVGYGKTLIIIAILGAVRSLESGYCVALAMATTGITSNWTWEAQSYILQMCLGTTSKRPKCAWQK